MRPSWARLQARVTLGQVTLDKGDHPATRNPVLASNLTFTTSFDQHGRDHQLRHSHRSTLVVGCKRCPETAVTYVVNSHRLQRRIGIRSDSSGNRADRPTSSGENTMHTTTKRTLIA